MKTTAIIKGLVLSKFFGVPFYCKVYVTRRCDLRCRMCSVWKHADRKSEMDLEGFQKVAETLRRLRVPTVVITGGEPFLRPDLSQIVSIFSKSGFSVRLQTNGGCLVTNERLKEVIEAGVDDINISLDSLYPEKHDAICQAEGVWENAVESIKYAVSELPHGIVGAATTITSQNIDELPELIRFVDSLGAFSLPLPVMLQRDTGSGNLFRGYSEGLELDTIDPDTVDRVFSEILRMKKSGVKVLFPGSFLKKMAEIIKTQNIKWSCDAGQLYFIVLPDGSVSPCDDILPISHMIEEDFFAVYHSKDYKKKVSRIQASCEGCVHGCWREVSGLIHSNQVLLEHVITFFSTHLSPLSRVPYFVKSKT